MFLRSALTDSKIETTSILRYVIWPLSERIQRFWPVFDHFLAMFLKWRTKCVFGQCRDTVFPSATTVVTISLYDYVHETSSHQLVGKAIGMSCHKDLAAMNNFLRR